jgi:radical SAM protein with 4Fe4S-binding SPASM domain
MIKYAREADIADIIEIFTNGSKLNPTLNKAMVDAGLQRINISLEGLTSQRYLEVAAAKVDMVEFNKNIQNLYEYSRTTGDLIIYVKIVDKASALKKDNVIYSMTDEERELFYKTYGNIADEVYIEKIVPQWAETQEEKQNDLEYTGMYDQKTVKYKKICPFVFMYLHINHDGITSPCTLDWPRAVAIGDVKKETPVEIWNGKKLKDIQIEMLKGNRDKINFCNKCSAPMVCCEENLDPFAEEILKKIS